MNRILISTIAVVAGLAAPATAETFDLQSVFGLNVPSIGPSPVHWADKVRLMTNGEVDVTVHGSGDFVPPFEVFGAVSAGAIPMGFDWIGYWAGQIPVANLVGSMPFGPSPEIALAWMFEGGGMEIIQKAYDPHNVKIIPCHLVVPEAGGWFNKEINTVDDLKGLNMRIAGLGRAGIGQAGCEHAACPRRRDLRFAGNRPHRRCRVFGSATRQELRVPGNHPELLFPGWHQPSSWDSIIVNMDTWNGLSEQNQQAMVEACKANITDNLADQLNQQISAIEEIEAAGVNIKRFPDEVLAAMQQAATEVMEEEAAKDPIFGEAYESLTSYVARVGRWSELQALPR